MSATLAMPSGDAPKSPGSEKPALFPLRKRTGTAHRRLLSHAADVDIDELYALSEAETVRFMAEARWGSSTFMSCPHCGTMDEHYWSNRELRWKCCACGKRFSVTSGTPFADHKLPLNKILRMVFQWAQPAAGRPATDLRKEHSISYRSAYTLAQKLREGLMRGFNVGLLCGVQEMDGLDLNGKRYKEKRNKPQSGTRHGEKGKAKIPEHLLKEEVDPETGLIGPPKPIKYDKTARQPADRRLLIVMRQRGQLKKRGAIHTRVCIALKEAATTVVAMAQRFSSAESHFMTDEDPAYDSFSRLFERRDKVKHSETYALPGGINNNQAESFNRRMRRLAEGVYLSPSNKYLADYACEAAWREDVREPSTGERLKALLKTALNVGLSVWWRGYWQGQYRKHEVLIEGPRDALGRGKKKGARPKVPR